MFVERLIIIGGKLVFILSVYLKLIIFKEIEILDFKLMVDELVDDLK